MSLWVITNAITAWLLPPGLLLALVLYGAWRARRKPRSGKALIGVAIVSLWLLSLPCVSTELLRWIEPDPVNPLQNTHNTSAQAIVVLGGGKYHAAPEYGTDTVSEPTLVRLRYAAHLHRLTRKPILVSGGSPEGSALSEAQAMKSVLEREFQVPVTWAEDGSNNTLENARASFRILNAQGTRNILLITHAWHMPRSKMSFERAGFNVTAAPTAYSTRFKITVLDFLPSAYALRDSSRVFHEIIGIVWYRLKFALDQ